MFTKRYKYQKKIKGGQSFDHKYIYFDLKKRKDVFVKMGSNLEELKYEFECQKYFYSLSKKFRRMGVYIPNPIEVTPVGNQYALVSEYLPVTKNLLSMESPEQVKIYIKVLKFLQEIGIDNSQTGKTHILKSGLKKQLASFPFLVGQALLRYPDNWWVILRSFVKAVKIYIHLNYISENYICHGDINVSNIYISGNKVVLVDFAQTRKSHRYYNFAQTLNSSWYKSHFQEILLRKIIQEFGLNERDLKTLELFTMINLFARLGKKYDNSKQEKFYFQRLENLLKKGLYRDLDRLAGFLHSYGYFEISPLTCDEFGRLHGVIRDSKGNKYFVKAVSSKNRYAYRSLYSEAVITKYVSRLTNKLKLKRDGYRLKVPLVEKIIRSKNIVCLLTNYIDGAKLIDKSSGIKSQYLIKTLELVDILGGNIKISRIRSFLKNYSITGILVSLPSKLVKAVIRNPSKTTELISIAQNVLHMLTAPQTHSRFVHGDINASNIIIKKRTIYLTDWEESGVGFPIFNTISPLCVHWEDKIIRNCLIRRFSKESDNLLALLSFRILVLFNQNIGKDNSKRKRDLNILEFVTNFNNLSKINIKNSYRFSNTFLKKSIALK